MEDYIRRYVTKDGKERITIYRDEHADNPRYNTDEPLHCEDWSRDYTIMTKKEREYHSSSARNLIEHFLNSYGNVKEMIKVLRANAAAEKHEEDDCCLVYDTSRHEWILKTWIGGWKDYTGQMHGNEWCEEVSFALKLKNITAYDLASYMSDSMIEAFCDAKFFTDGIKIGSYSFGYQGTISFDDSFSTDSEGICWLEKDEFLKYSGCKEEYWNSKTLREIEFLIDEIEAWGDNEVYGFKVEKAVKTIKSVRYPDGEHDDTETEETEWEETGSCWGFYGELDKSIEWILEDAGFKKEELIEE
jgi:hypothetical protein